jgi:hypothetical protein
MERNQGKIMEPPPSFRAATFALWGPLYSGVDVILMFTNRAAQMWSD